GFGLLKTALEAAAATGRIQRGSIEMLAHVLLAATLELALVIARSRDPAALAEAEKAVSALIGGLGPPAGPRPSRRCRSAWSVRPRECSRQSGSPAPPATASRCGSCRRDGDRSRNPRSSKAPARTTWGCARAASRRPTRARAGRRRPARGRDRAWDRASMI